MENKTIVILDGLKGNDVVSHNELQKFIIENIDIISGFWRSLWVLVILILVYVIVREFIRNNKNKKIDNKKLDNNKTHKK
ncbi:MAG: hypothetical protein KC589_01055 [Nanoarchaeota archaeon]|nr:hypothetical protein [Nanoarchaeota archaeon]